MYMYRKQRARVREEMDTLQQCGAVVQIPCVEMEPAAAGTAAIQHL